ncbi:PREDICTED: transcription factor bHLH120-like [Nicotiana attenuata]|uniref:Transcription factor bhlh126 n=1 Tax=Nicotiana attenuata TaxID=49451 RepID=A0A1J6IE63_NICAT|nr:PREDICTED: transcription factor bHLH120-like [Nicotiana attenuata]OIT03182.1 transcription factor bhlh126 [Nicotiana attenuata]
MDDYDQFDYAQVEHLLHLLSSSPPPLPPPLTTNSSVPLQTQSCNLVNTPVPKRKAAIANIDQDTGKGKPPKEKENTEKKVVRRDVERQRRRDMARLYQRLRLLIPSKYLMGKRSISDHLEEIVDYIKDMRKNIEELESKRERLKEMRNICSSDHNSHLDAPSSSMKIDDNQDRIIVKKCEQGVEISVISNLGGGLALSKVLRVLMEERLLVISCVSSKINQRSLHIIQSEVNSRGDIDLGRLQFKLMSLSYKL